MTDTSQTFNDWVQTLAKATDDSPLAFSHEFRTHHLVQAESQDFPSRKDEEWRYTPLKAVLNRGFSSNSSASIASALLDGFKRVMPEAIHLIFTDGNFDIEASDSFDARTPNGLHIKELTALSVTERKQAEQLITGAKFTDDNSFHHIGLGLSRSGLFIQVDRDIEINKPLHILHLNTQAKGVTLNNPITLIQLAENSQLKVVQQFASIDNAESLSIPTDIFQVQTGAKLDIYKLGLESQTTDHISNSAVELASSASFTSHQYLLGSRLTRTNLEVSLQGSDANAVLRGVYLGQDKQHLDIRTYMDHAHEDCASDQHFRGIMDDQSRGVFNGMVLVRKDSQRTDAQQSNKNLLLSRDARIDTKPQLEIFADDVKCTHGATIGELDSDALFYLQSRGISKSDAMLMLTKAFSAEITDEIEFESLREHVQAEILNQLVIEKKKNHA